MSVYKRPGAQTYSYDFRLGGRRFLGGTGETTRRSAVEHEKTRREQARQEVATEEAMDAPRTWELAASRWYLEVGKHHKNAGTTIASLEWLTNAIAKDTLLSEINDNRVAALVSKRRNEFRQVGKPENRTKKVGPATVNRTVTEALRKVMLRAQKIWKVRVGEVNWGQHMLAEPKERVREASSGEETAIMMQLERGYEEALRFAFLNGCRRMEILSLVWQRVDFFGRQFTLIGKGDKLRTIPMSDETFNLLWAQRGHHDEIVFTFEAQKNRRERNQVRGRRYPLTESGLKSAVRRAVPAAGVQNFRFHDTRHTAATRVLRASNLRVAQILLGHEDVKTTTKYAHALAEDVRNALNATSTANIAARPTGTPSKRKSGE